MKYKTRKFVGGGLSGGTDYGPPGTTDYASSGSAGGTNIDFKDAFRAARKQGLGTFTWRGKKYTTELASEKKSDSSESASSGTSGGPTSRSGPRFSSGTSGGPTNRGGPRRQEVTISAKREKPSMLSRVLTMKSGGGGVKKYAKGGSTRGDGVCRVKTRGRFV